MTRRVRIAILVPALLGTAALLYWAVAGLPHFGSYQGPYGYVINKVARPERHTTNAVAATVFDYRGFDTMGEEFILFAAVMGVVLLLRHGGQEEGDERTEDLKTVGSDALRVVGGLAVGVTMLVGLWLISFGYITPGGGFQGGVVVAAGAILLYLATGYRTFKPFGNESILDPIEGIGVGGYTVIGLAALVGGMPFLHNLLGEGETGTLWSGGSIGFLNWATALEVAAANLVLVSEFLDEYIVPLSRRQS